MAYARLCHLRVSIVDADADGTTDIMHFLTVSSTGWSPSARIDFSSNKKMSTNRQTIHELMVLIKDIILA